MSYHIYVNQIENDSNLYYELKSYDSGRLSQHYYHEPKYTTTATDTDDYEYIL